MSQAKVKLALLAMIRVVFYVPRSRRLKLTLVSHPETKYKFHNSALWHELFNVDIYYICQKLSTR